MSKFDAYWDNPLEYENRESAREGAWNTFLGVLLLVASVWSLIAGRGGPTFWWFLLAISFLSLKIGIGNLRLYNRYRQGYGPQVPPDKREFTALNLSETPYSKLDEFSKPTTKRELPSPDFTSMVGPPSVTEGTTELLNVKPSEKS